MFGFKADMDDLRRLSTKMEQSKIDNRRADQQNQIRSSLKKRIDF